MSLQRRILKGIDDLRPVLSHSERRGPLNELIDGYMVLAIHNDNLPNINITTTGAELKAALELLEPEIELDLLKKYSDGQRAILYPHLKLVNANESPEKVDERRQRHWLMRAAFISLNLFIGGVVFAAYRSGDLGDGKVIGPVMMVVSDVAKLIFSSK